MGVKRSAQIVRDPLSHTCGEVFLAICADRVKRGNRHHGEAGEFQHGQLVRTNEPLDMPHDGGMALLRAQDIVQHDL